jgi:Fe(3+) dicitrate transport protein
MLRSPRSHFRPALVAALLAAGSAVTAQEPAPRPAPQAGPTRDSIAQLPGLSIIGSADERSRIPGSAKRLDAAVLTQARVLSTNEALRKVSGIVVRDEDGLGLRPNIGIRGLNPTRSTKTLLLEDGVPVTLAPYGDNAAYYHPPIGRMESIEVLKGAGQILHGPQTVGGVINYITPGLPSRSAGLLRLSGGSNDFANGYLRASSVNGEGGAALDLGRWRGVGARENTSSDVADASLKLFVPLANGQRLIAKTNVYREGSQITYSGLTEGEWAADPRSNPFRNDRFDIGRVGGSVAHEWRAGPRKLVTTAYAHDISRDWWRQSSNSSQRPSDANDPNCGSIANLESGCGNEGRLRRYQVMGIEPRYAQPLLMGALAGTLDVGARVHREVQLRRQVNGPTHDARSGTLAEDNRRSTDALAAFAQARIGSERWSITPGLRVEHIAISRTNRMPVAGNPAGVSGRTSLTELIPGLGATLTLSDALGLFAGAHRGFAPPRNEDIISNSTGGVLELDPERSWNYELGARFTPANGWSIDATVFRMDFENQIVPASVAGGTGATLTAAGRTLHQGAELDLRGDLPSHGRLVPFVSLAATWLPIARYEGERYAFIGTGGSDVVNKVYAEQNAAGTRTALSVTGNRLPYAPEFTLTGSIGLRHLAGFDVSVEAVHLGMQYGDPANTRLSVADGQQGLLPASTLWNAAMNWRSSALDVTLFASVKNAFDALILVDRTRGMLPAMGRVVMLGVERSF